MSRQTVIDAHGRALRIIARSLHDDFRGVGEEIADSAGPGDLAATTTILAMLFAQFVESTAATWTIMSGEDRPWTGAELWAELATQVQEPPPGSWDWEDVGPELAAWWRAQLRGKGPR